MNATTGAIILLAAFTAHQLVRSKKKRRARVTTAGAAIINTTPSAKVDPAKPPAVEPKKPAPPIPPPPEPEVQKKLKQAQITLWPVAFRWPLEVLQTTAGPRATAWRDKVPGADEYGQSAGITIGAYGDTPVGTKVEILLETSMAVYDANGNLVMCRRQIFTIRAKRSGTASEPFWYRGNVEDGQFMGHLPCGSPHSPVIMDDPLNFSRLNSHVDMRFDYHKISPIWIVKGFTILPEALGYTKGGKPPVMDITLVPRIMSVSS